MVMHHRTMVGLFCCILLIVLLSTLSLPPTEAPEEPPTCGGWVFARYIASNFELEWRTDIAVNQLQVCERYRGHYARHWQVYMDTVPRLSPHMVVHASSCHQNKMPRPGFDNETFSVFQYEWGCDASRRQNVFIEPLAGILRHPGVCADQNMLVDKSYMLLDGWASHMNQSPQRRFFYFDLGASTWSTGAGGASQEWFVAIYENLCIKFDHVYAWEATRVRFFTIVHYRNL